MNNLQKKNYLLLLASIYKAQPALEPFQGCIKLPLS